MFENVPETLIDFVKGIPAEERIGSMRYALPAGMVIVQYLRRNPTGAPADDFFDPNLDGSVSYEHTVRLMMVGETLFLLRSHPAFSEFCRRFHGRNFRSTFYELLSARMFLRGKFEIHARPESGIKGDDFDFKAVGPSDLINVEVTTLTAPSFSMKTVKNALDAKRKQLPNDAPAIIFCVYPESWFLIGPDRV